MHRQDPGKLPGAARGEVEKLVRRMHVDDAGRSITDRLAERCVELTQTPRCEGSQLGEGVDRKQRLELGQDGAGRRKQRDRYTPPDQRSCQVQGMKFSAIASRVG